MCESALTIHFFSFSLLLLYQNIFANNPFLSLSLFFLLTVSSLICRCPYITSQPQQTQRPWANRTASSVLMSCRTSLRTRTSPNTRSLSGTRASCGTAPAARSPWRSSRRSMPTSSLTETPPSLPNTSSARLTPMETGL